MSRTIKPYCYKSHHYIRIKVKKWYRTNGNRWYRRNEKAKIRKYDPDSTTFRHPKFEAWDWWYIC